MISHIVAVGDIHGQNRKLLQLLRMVKSHMAALGRAYGEDWNFIFLGDYIDYGPDSMEVVERLRGLERSGAICLLGNHEDVAVQDRVPYDRETLNSYGGADEAHRSGSLFFQHLDWFTRLPLFHQTDNHIFVHAGVRPYEPLEEQLTRPNKQVLLWIRDLFLNEQKDFGRYVVHGHTVTRQATPDIRENRCNLDTGAGYGRRLSAAVFDLSQRHPVHTFSI
jgi:serine/threonine protein phosphatase 1